MKIRSHLMILVLGAVLPLFAFSAAMTTIFWREQRRSVEERFLERVGAMTNALDREFDGQIEILNVLAQSELLRSAKIKEFYEHARRVRDAQTSWSTFIVADPSGQILQKASVDQEENLIVEVDLGALEFQRTHWPFLRDRRIDAYADLTKRFIE